MSDSNLKLPSTTEMEVRVREALKVARHGLSREDDMFRRDPLSMGIPATNALKEVIRILEDGRS